MIQLPAGFDEAQLVSDLVEFCVPFIGVIFLIACGTVVFKILKRA